MPKKSMTNKEHKEQSLTLACLAVVAWAYFLEAPHGLPRDEMQSGGQSLMKHKKSVLQKQSR
jgi:hypothetical protein